MGKVGEEASRREVVMSQGDGLHLKGRQWEHKGNEKVERTSGLSCEANLKITAISRGEVPGAPGGTIPCFFKTSSSINRWDI